MGEREGSGAVKQTCKPRVGTCTKKGTEVRVLADVRIAWIDYMERHLCEEHAKEWDAELDLFLADRTNDRWGVTASWAKARDMNLFMKDGLSFKEAYDLVQSGHGYKRPTGPVRIS